MKIDGRKISEVLLEQCRIRAMEAEMHIGRKPKLVVLQVGNDEASNIYVRNKQNACNKAGVDVENIHRDLDISAASLMVTIDSLNSRNDVDAIMVQLPLPGKLHSLEQYIIDRIKPSKDADGLTSASLGRLIVGNNGFKPCTPLGIMMMLDSIGVELEGMDIAIVGRSCKVGKPLQIMMTEKNATVALCHSKTENVEDYTRKADIVITAVGKPDFLKADMIKDGAIVIDVGISRKNGKVVGDCDEDVSLKAGFYTPVPGGVGPMTVACLVSNTIDAAEKSFIRF